MPDLLVILVIFVSLKGYQAVGNEHLLICPSGYQATSQAWYSEEPNNTSIDGIRPSDVDYTFELTSPYSSFNPTTFSVCAICTFENDSSEVELCMGHKSLKTKNLVYERRNCSEGDHYETLVWFNATNPVGIQIDMSNEDLLTTLQNIQAITDSSLQPDYLDCPAGLQLERFEERSADKSKYRSCIICSGGQYLFSSCGSEQEAYSATSVLIPNLLVTIQDCPWNQNSSRNNCQLEVKELVKTKEAACGIFFHPHNYSLSGIMAKDLNFDCPIEGKLFRALLDNRF